MEQSRKAPTPALPPSDRPTSRAVPAARQAFDAPGAQAPARPRRLVLRPLHAAAAPGRATPVPAAWPDWHDTFGDEDGETSSFESTSDLDETAVSPAPSEQRPPLQPSGPMLARTPRPAPFPSAAPDPSPSAAPVTAPPPIYAPVTHAPTTHAPVTHAPTTHAPTAPIPTPASVLPRSALVPPAPSAPPSFGAPAIAPLGPLPATLGARDLRTLIAMADEALVRVHAVVRELERRSTATAASMHSISDARWARDAGRRSVAVAVIVSLVLGLGLLLTAVAFTRGR